MEKDNPEIIIVSKEGYALIYCDGKVYGDHLTDFQFRCNGISAETTYTANQLPITGSDDVQRIKDIIESIMN